MPTTFLYIEEKTTDGLDREHLASSFIAISQHGTSPSWAVNRRNNPKSYQIPISPQRRPWQHRASRFDVRSQSFLHHPDRALHLSGIPDTHSAIGSVAGTLSDGTLPDQLGLTVLYEPEDAPSVHIVFVHGLRGKSQETWAKDQKPELFWPKAWLPREEGINNARISTFGYDANFMARGPHRTWTITDFAKDLLFELDFTSGSADLRIGKVPVIFIAHSMGGLVVKKACILGAAVKQDAETNSPNTAIMFLSTPHYGSDLVTWLHLFGFGQFSKPYVSELKTNSLILREINNQFLRLVPLPTIASFYETMRTSIGPVKMMILRKESATFGHSDEIVKGLDADHHDVCKYSSTEDHNYVNVRDVLRRFVNQLRAKDTRPLHSLKSQELRQIRRVLDISETPNRGLEDVYRHYMPGSCQNFMSSHSFRTWLDNPSDNPHIIWINGPPGAGKSVLSSYIVHYLKERGRACQFYYFRFGEEKKTSVGTFLRSLAYQIAIDVPSFRERLAFLAEAPDFQHVEDGCDIWRRLFLHQFFQLNLTKPIYWILDGIDECQSPHLLLKLMAQLLSCALPLRVMFLGRRDDSLSASFRQLSRATELTEVSIEADRNDLSQYVRQQVRHMQDRPELTGFTEEIEGKVLRSAEGNFLWTRLALESVLQCKEWCEVEAALKRLHPEIASLYRRIEETLMDSLTNIELKLARTTLTWAVCSQRQLTFRELSEVLQPGADSWPDLLSSIRQVCGGFVMVNQPTSQVTVVHHSAGEYLTNASIDFRVDLPMGHRILFDKCLSVLCRLSSNFPGQDLTTESRFEIEPLLQYAASSWFYHLSKIDGASGQQSLPILAEFLSGPCAPVWICIVVSLVQLQPIVEAANSLRSFYLQQQLQANPESRDERRQEHMRVVDGWATDMLQITAKFGDHLIRHPRAIYSLVPAFCPTKSMVRKCRFTGLALVPSVKVVGVSHNEWDDCLARFPVNKNSNASNILCTDNYFAVSTTTFAGLAVDGRVGLYRTRTYEEVAMLTQEDAVLNMQFSASGRLLATSGNRHIRIWTTPDDPSGIVQLIGTLSNPDTSRVLAFTFSADDQSIITYSRDGKIQRMCFSGIMTGWEVVGIALGGIGTREVKGPSCAAFNHNASSIAIGFRGAPMAVWKLAPFQPIRYYHRKNVSWTGVDRIEWNHASGHVIGLYDDGCGFKWTPSETGEAVEFPADAISIKCNLKGNFFATSSGDSSLTVWDFEQCVPVYELSLPANVTDLAISPDGRLLYDLRDSYCTVWQPISLVHRRESTNRATPPRSYLKISKDITALAVGQKTSACCIGNMDGILQVISDDDRRLSIKSSFKAAIEHIAWSLEERYLATANVANQILVREVELAAVDAESMLDADTGTIFDEKVDAPVQQLFFNNASTLVFAATRYTLYIWEFREQPRLVAKSIVHNQYRWMAYPGNDNLLLGLTSNALSALRWQDLQQEFELGLELPTASELESRTPQVASEASTEVSLACIPSVDRVFTSCDGSLTFLQVGQLLGTRKVQDAFFILYTAGISSSGCDARLRTTLISLPRHLQALIQIPIGFVNIGVDATALSPSPSADRHESHLVFLSNEGWICTMYLGCEDVHARVKSHYFLPRSWLVKEALKLVEISASGTLFCPRNGEVGIVRNGLGIGWGD